MQYLKKSFNNIKNDSDKMEVINELISNLTNIRDNLTNNSNGNIFISYLGFNENELKEEIDELTEDYSDKEILEMKAEIKEKEYKLKIIKEIIDVSLDKEDYYDHDEGWKTTTKKIKVIINLKDNYKLKINLSHNHHGHDNTTDFYKYHYISKNDINLEEDKDYYQEKEKYYNGKKISKRNPISNFQKKLEQYCKKNKIELDQLSEEQVLVLLNSIKKESKKLKEEFENNEKNKNTTWTFLLNTILEHFDEDKFEDFFYEIK